MYTKIHGTLGYTNLQDDVEASTFFDSSGIRYQISGIGIRYQVLESGIKIPVGIPIEVPKWLNPRKPLTGLFSACWTLGTAR